MSELHGLTVTDGIDQASRLPRALEDGYFHVDERDRATLIATVADLARHLRFVDLANNAQGNWAHLLEQEDACILARVLAFCPELRERTFARLLQREPEKAVVAILDLAVTIERWRRCLEVPKTPAGAEFKRRIDQLIETRLAASVARARELANAAGVLWPTDPQDSDLLRTWAVGRPIRDARPDSGPRATLRLAFYDLLNGVRFLQGQAPAFFAESLNRADHEPASGLVFGFIQLFERVQAKLNGFTAKHNEFYYHKVLGTRRRQPGPDHVLLRFLDVTNDVAVPVRRGSAVVATMPDGQQRRFVTDTDAFASGARLQGLYTLHFERDLLLSPARELDYVTRIGSAELSLNDADELESASTTLLGAGPQAGVHARLGVCFSSPTLTLREGRRRVRLSVVLRPQSASPAMAEDVWHALLELEDQDNDPITAVRHAFMSRLLADPGLVSGIGRKELLDTVMRVTANRSPDDFRITENDRESLPEDPLQVVFLLELMKAADGANPRSFTAPFGRLVGRLWLAPERRTGPQFDGKLDPMQTLADRIVEIADKVFEGRGAEDEGRVGAAEIRPLLLESQAYQYEKYLRDAFSLELTTAEGWHRIEDFALSPLADTAGRFGLTFGFELDADAPAIVTNAAAAAAVGRDPVAPMARLLLAEGATLCAFSLLEPYVLDEIDVRVDVKGLRSLVLHSDVGPLDPNQLFQPFGPTPRNGASLIVGAYETALKALEHMRLRLTWSGLPTEFGGFETHYEGYGTQADGYAYAVAPAWLEGGAWRPVQIEPLPLFHSVNSAQVLPEDMTIELDLPRVGRPLSPRAPESSFTYGLNARSGFVCLTLTGPPEAFGHTIYPILFARSVSRFLSRRRAPALLNAPYTPTLSRVEMDYRARSQIRVAGVPAEMAHQRGEFVDHVWPFGVEEIHPEPIRQQPGPMPPRWCDGMLHIGLDMLKPGQPITLLFYMAERARRRRSFEPPVLTWSYRTDAGWQSLPATRILADTTSGLMRPGVVTVSIPDDATLSRTGVPASAVWLRVGADADLAAFPRLSALFVNGLSANEDRGNVESLPEKVAWRLELGMPGLEAIQQIGAAERGTPAETDRQYRTRVSERLRHRGRAMTAWDYERLVLQRFPSVWKVKCFPVTDDRRWRKATPAQVLVVVVPRPTLMDDDEAVHELRMFDVLTLRRIQKDLETLAPSSARIEVRNPTYDLLQVRCRIGFDDEADRGLMLRQLSAQVSRYLSPWIEEGPTPGFGWQFRAEDVQAFIAEQPAVSAVSEFAMLMVASADRPDDIGASDSQRLHRLIDTARAETTVQLGDGHDNVLSFSVPWSLPLPLARQALLPSDLRGAPDATPAGVGDLAVGSTLVVSGEST